MSKKPTEAENRNENANGIPDENELSSLALGVQWSSRITSIALEMVLPAVLGIWIDSKLGTEILFTVLGGILGMSAAMMHLLRISKEEHKKKTEKPGRR